MMPSAWGTMTAAKAPWSSRAAISRPDVGASAHSSDMTVKPHDPTTNMKRRPRMSPIRAAGIRPSA